MDERDHRKAMEAMKKSVTISHDMAVALVKKCREKNFNYLISPYESDSQLTYLQKNDIIDFIMSEDSDLLVFGDPEFTKVIFKTNFDTESGDLIVLKDIFGSLADDKFFTFTQDMFRIMCILSGCDYLASIRNIGLRRSFAAVKQNIDITTTMVYFKSNRQLDIPPEYEQNVRKSLECFKSQIVIDPFLLREVSLYESCSQREVIFDKLTGMSAIHFMHGNIHPHTGQLKLLFDITKPCIDCYSILHFKLKSNAVQAIDVPAAQQADQTITRVDNEDTDDRLFSLPFMVLGSAHHSEMQTHLESFFSNLFFFKFLNIIPPNANYNNNSVNADYNSIFSSPVISGYLETFLEATL